MQDHRLTARKLADLRTVLVASPGYLRLHGMPEHIEDLRQHACLRYITPSGPYPWTWADGTNLVPDGHFDTNDGTVLRYAALSDAGIAQLSEVAVAAEIEAGSLAVVLPELRMSGLEIHAVHAYGRQVPARVRVFMEFCGSSSLQLQSRHGKRPKNRRASLPPNLPRHSAAAHRRGELLAQPLFDRQVQVGLDSANADRLVSAAEVEAKCAVRRAATRRRLEASE